MTWEGLLFNLASFLASFYFPAKSASNEDPQFFDLISEIKTEGWSNYYKLKKFQ